MTKWSKVKVALLAAATLAAIQFGGCLNLGDLFSSAAWKKVEMLVTVDNLFD